MLVTVGVLTIFPIRFCSCDRYENNLFRVVVHLSVAMLSRTSPDPDPDRG